MMLYGATPWRLLSRSALLRQLRRYMLVGLANNAVAFGTLNLCLLLFASRSRGSLVLYSSAAYLLSTVNSYLLNRRWTFRRGQRQSRTAWRFGLLNAITFGLNALCVLLLTTLLPLLLRVQAEVLANLSTAIATLICGLINFIASRLWVFQVARPTRRWRAATRWRFRLREL
jgi:putative flippase GtrA